MAEGTGCPDTLEIIRRLDGLSDREYAPKEYVRFRIDVLKAQTEVRAALVRSPPALLTRSAGQAAGVPPLVGPDEVPFDQGLLMTMLERLFSALERRSHVNEGLQPLWDTAADDPRIIGELARETAFHPDAANLNSFADRVGASTESLLFFGRILAAPFVTDAVARRRSESGEAGGAAGMVHTGRCPYCASPPGLAILSRGEGRRILCCSFCAERWDFTRVECPFCGDRAALEMLSVQDDDVRWVESCDSCKRYLKTVDERKFAEGEEVVALVETIATLYFDLVAEKQGCVRAMPYAALR